MNFCEAIRPISNPKKKTRPTRRIRSNPLIVRSSRSGRHLPIYGVAVVSQVLCTSATLNKRTVFNFPDSASYNTYSTLLRQVESHGLQTLEEKCPNIEQKKSRGNAAALYHTGYYFMFRLLPQQKGPRALRLLCAKLRRPRAYGTSESHAPPRPARSRLRFPGACPENLHSRAGCIRYRR